MTPFRLLPALRRAIYFVQDLHQYHAIRNFDVHQYGRAFSTRKRDIVAEFDNGNVSKKPKPKTVPVPKITLLSPDESITVTDLENAQRLAKRRKLTLVKISDLDKKTQRPIFKLVNNSTIKEELEDATDIENEASSESGKIKSTKLLYISAKIAKNDLLTKIKNISNLLRKGHKVKIFISLDDVKEDKTYSLIEEAVKNNGSIQKMPSKKNSVLLLITPLLTKKTESSVNNKKEISASDTVNQNDNT